MRRRWGGHFINNYFYIMEIYSKCCGDKVSLRGAEIIDNETGERAPRYYICKKCNQKCDTLKFFGKTDEERNQFYRLNGFFNKLQQG
jgi:hypothetical protein